jgi:hypothetical protein
VCEIRGAIERVDIPDKGRGRIVLAGAFFGYDGMLRKIAAQTRNDCCFRLPICFGDQIDVTFVDYFFWPGVSGEDDAARFARGFDGSAEKLVHDF